MLTRHYTLHFATPAFLGNAEQSGQWRTPPIKALLRQWWRVAYAAGQPGAVNVSAMREAEGRLFGSASHNGGRPRPRRYSLSVGLSGQRFVDGIELP